MLKLDTALTLVPYLLAAAYAAEADRHPRDLRDDEEPERRKQLPWSRSSPSSTPSSCCTPPGPEYLLLGCLVYAPGTLLFLMARREQGLRAFNRPEVAICALLWTAAVVGIVAISTGYVEI